MTDYDVVLPDFPRTKHLPWNPNAQRDDLIATERECSILFDSDRIHISEKVDGANVGITTVDGEPLIRNRNHVLRKSHVARTAAKAQFNPVWNWFYENVGSFQYLEHMGPFTVYGEWLLAQHSVAYDQLPEFFLAFDLWDQQTRSFVDPIRAAGIISDAGLRSVPQLHMGRVKNSQQLEDLVVGKSAFSSTSLREGIYIKVGDGLHLTHRFKMVRQDFIAGEHWNSRQITKNTKLKGGRS